MSPRTGERGIAKRARSSAVAVLVVACTVMVAAACDPEREMPERAEMPDTMEVKRALEHPRARDSMLDTLPGGEMARGDSAAAERLLRDKMP